MERARSRMDAPTAAPVSLQELFDLLPDVPQARGLCHPGAPSSTAPPSPHSHAPRELTSPRLSPSPVLAAFRKAVSHLMEEVEAVSQPAAT